MTPDLTDPFYWLNLMILATIATAVIYVAGWFGSIVESWKLKSAAQEREARRQRHNTS